MSRKSQDSFYLGETFDLAEVAVTYTAAGLGAAKYTAGVAYYSRLDLGAIGALNGFISALWSKGSGTAGTVYWGLYQAVPGTSGESNGTLYQIASTANVGGVATGVVRQQLLQVGSASVNFTSTAFPATGNPIGGDNTGVFYAGLVVATDAGTNHVDVASSTAFAANMTAALVADPTGGGGWPRACTGAGTSLTKLPLSEAISGVTGSVICPWLAVD